MDSAKAIAAGALYDGDVWELFGSREHKAIAPTKALPTIMVPTMAATSSEMNHIAVITNDETMEKSSTRGTVLYPKVSILDPSLTCTISAYQTACGAADAISHVMEAYLNGDHHSPVQDHLQEALIKSILEEVPEILRNPTDVTHRANFQWAATLCWNGWMQAGLNAATPMHKLGHAISARYDTTHGATLAIFLNAYCHYIASISSIHAARLANLATQIYGIPPASATHQDFLQPFTRFLRSIGVPTTLTEAGIPKEDLEQIANDVCWNCGGALPGFPINREGILQILQLAT